VVARLAAPSEEGLPLTNFTAEIEFQVACISLQAAGRELRRLSEAAATAGFTLIRARVLPTSADQDDPSAGTSYGPLTDPRRSS
jgi:hypothetical protein